jgi:hypothetical protein
MKKINLVLPIGGYRMLNYGFLLGLGEDLTNSISLKGVILVNLFFVLAFVVTFAFFIFCAFPKTFSNKCKKLEQFVNDNNVNQDTIKTIYPSLEKHTGKCFKQEIKLTMNIIPITNCNLPVWAFGTVLQALKWFEQSLNHNLEDTEFDPEITLKQEITFKIKSSEIQF